VTAADANGTDATGHLQHAGRHMIESRLPYGSQVVLVRRLGGGFTDAVVILCDVDPGPVNAAATPIKGQYILKVEPTSSASQSTAHDHFCRQLANFAADHVPRLVMSVQDAGVSADLYEIAGLSLDNLRTAEHLDYEDREEVCARAAEALLRAQLETCGPPDYSTSVIDVMREWLGPQFPRNERSLRIREVARSLKVVGPAFHYDGEILPDPITLFGAQIPATDLACFRGTAHGDLHLRNILARGSRQTRDLTYWLIDVNWLDPAPLLYDQSYLELATLLYALRNAGPARLLGVLSKLDNAALTVPVQLGVPDRGIVDLVSRIRQATVATLEQYEAGRSAVWRRQHLLARIAAGLNWAAKPLDPTLRRAAFLTAAWTTRLLLRGFEEYAEVWADLAQQDRTAATAAVPTAVTTKEALDRWSPFHSSSTGLDLFLIADEGLDDETLACLAFCRWAAVIDLDAQSDENGLAHIVIPVMRTRRHVSLFGENQQLTSPDSATNWLMANGWHRLHEPAAGSAKDWSYMGRRVPVRALVDHVVNATPNRAAAVLCLRSGRQDDSIIEFVVDYIAERYQGIDIRLDLATGSALTGVDLSTFVAAIAPTQETAGPGSALTLPGKDGPCPLTREDLNRLEVDLEVLHSEMLAESTSPAPRLDEFWRGRPPTWDEFEASLDVRRTAVHSPLFDDLRARLDDHQLALVGLEHSPGAGGTTLARRVAWDLHREHPTALLRRLTPTTVERIDEIYQSTGKTVLLVTEATDLPEANRDELVNELRQRNSRAVILWVNRTNISSGTAHKLMDPVTGAERDHFVREYLRRAETDRGRDLLTKLYEGAPADIPANRLSPFYFGLCAYDVGFQGVRTYVDNHLVRLGARQLRVARYLALVTRYAQLGLLIDLVRRWLGKEMPDSGEYGDEELREMLGADLRHLTVVERGELRLLHPLIADQVLDGNSAGMKVNLAQLAVDLIDEVVDSLGSDNAWAVRLLTEVFVRRRGWNEERHGRREHFAEIIQRMPTPEGGERVFEQLTKRCPKEPHFWNHRGRFHIYRLKGDYRRAEEFVTRAVEESDSNVPLHLHTLGMVRRFWIEHDLNEARISGLDEESALAAIRPRFDQAMEAFSVARENSGGVYNWVTPIQLITFVVDRLVVLSGASNLAEYLKPNVPGHEWVASTLHLAESLLDELRSLYVQSRTTGRYHDSLCHGLDVLYGDLDSLITQWRKLREESADRSAVGLVLARALYVQSGRTLASLSDDRVRDIVSMISDTVRSSSASDADLRLWFRAIRRLPEYSEVAALEQLSWYASQTDSLDATYYLYILHFLRWYRRDSQNTERARSYLENCQRLSRRRRNQLSFEWLGHGEPACPLVHYTELGRRRLEYDNFWENSYLLQRVHGIIDEIKGPQAGSISIRVDDAGRFPVFFSPREKFLKSRDINRAVEFYLGFSYEGLRAWAVEYPGMKPESLRKAEIARAEVESRRSEPGTRRDPRTAQPPPEPPAAGPGITATLVPVALPRQHAIDAAFLRTVAEAMPNGYVSDYQIVIIEHVLRAREQGHVLTGLRLGETLQRHFGIRSYEGFRAGPGKLRGAVERLGFRTIATSSSFEIDLP
jgi:hypothetical protein